MWYSEGNLVGGGERECIIPVIATLGLWVHVCSKQITKAKKTSQKSKSIAAESRSVLQT